ncbi:uncharacterized protein LOC144718557 [Lampetra planeri]
MMMDVSTIQRRARAADIWLAPPQTARAAQLLVLLRAGTRTMLRERSHPGHGQQQQQLHKPISTDTALQTGSSSSYTSPSAPTRHYRQQQQLHKPISPDTGTAPACPGRGDIAASTSSSFTSSSTSSSTSSFTSTPQQHGGAAQGGPGPPRGRSLGVVGGVGGVKLAMAQGSEDALRPLLRNYRFRDLTLMEVRLAGARYAELHPGRDVYVATNGIDKNLLHLSGTIPVIYEGFEYNMPVRLWLPESFPYSPPLAFVQPTQDMILNPGHHVDSRGRVYLPYLQHWTHPNSTTCGLLQAMADVFAKEPPVSALPRRPTSPLPYNSWQ